MLCKHAVARAKHTCPNRMASGTQRVAAWLASERMCATHVGGRAQQASTQASKGGHVDGRADGRTGARTGGSAGSREGANRIRWHLAVFPSLMTCRTDKVGKAARAEFCAEFLHIATAQHLSANRQLGRNTSNTCNMVIWDYQRVDGAVVWKSGGILIASWELQEARRISRVHVHACRREETGVRIRWHLAKIRHCCGKTYDKRRADVRA